MCVCTLACVWYPRVQLLTLFYSSAGDPSALVVLVEEELVVIDLQTEGWPVIQTPYLVPLHSSAITCSHHISAIPLKLWERIIVAGGLQNTHYSKKVHRGQMSPKVSIHMSNTFVVTFISNNICKHMLNECQILK